MNTVDPFRLPRPKREIVTRTFSADGVSITLAFRRPDVAEMNRAAEVARQLVADFITGDAREDRPPADFFDGIPVSESYFVLCASAEQMQPPPDLMPEGCQRYDAVNFAVLLDRLPTDGPRIAAFVREMQVDWRASSGNSPGAPTGDSAAARSEPQEATPNTSLDTTRSSSASTPDWVSSVATTATTPALR